MRKVLFGLGIGAEGSPRQRGLSAARAARAQVGDLPPALALLTARGSASAGDFLRGVREELPGVPLLGWVTDAAPSANAPADGGVRLFLLASPHVKAKVGAGTGHETGTDGDAAEAFDGSFIGAARHPGPDVSAEENLFRWYHYRRPSLALALVAAPPGERRERKRSLTAFLRERFKGGAPFLLFAPPPEDDRPAIIAGDRILQSGVALAMIKTDLQFSIERFHQFEPRGSKLYVTRADGDRILELNGRPAAAAYREAIGLPAAGSARGDDAPAEFSLFPLAHRGQDGRFRLILPVEAGEDGSLRFTAEPDPDQVLYPMSPVSSSEIWRGSGKGGRGGGGAHVDASTNVLVLRDSGLRDHATTFLDLAGGRREPGEALELSTDREVQAFLSPGDRGCESGHLLLAFRNELDPVSVAATENERLLEEVVRLKDLHQEIFDSIGFGIAVVDADRRVVFCNSVYQELTGTGEDAGPGAPCRWQGDAEGHCDSCAALEAIERQSFVTREVVRVEGGARQWLRIDAFPLRNGQGATGAAIEVLRDITTFKALRFSLESEQRKMEAVVRGMAETLYIANRSYELLFFHPGALPLPSAPGGGGPASRPCYAAIFGRDFPCPWCRMAEIMRTGAVDRRVARLQGEGGEERAYQITFSPWSDGPGEPTAVACLLVDISSQKRLEQQLIRSEKLNSLAILSAGMAHELNNPLGAINFNLEILKRRERDQEYREVLESIRRDTLRINRIVGNLLSFSRSGAAAYSWVRPTEVIDAALELFLVVLERRKVEVRKEYPEETPVIWGNGPDLQQVFINLISNAVDAMPAGGVISIAVSDGGSEEGPLPPVDVAVVYDHPGNLALLRSLQDEPGWRVNFFRGGDEAIDFFRRHHAYAPRVIVADYADGGSDRLNFFLLMAKEAAAEAKVLLIAPSGSAAEAGAYARGVDDVALLPLGPEVLVERVRAIQPISFAPARVEQPVTVTFSDNGVGMPPEIQERIFDPFFTTKDNRGTGLGLSVVHKILENHEARIRVQSRPGQGTTFVLRFPRRQEFSTELAAPSGREGGTAGGSR